jgi:transposase
MEACSGSHFLGRALREQGHDVKLIPAQFVKPFVKSNKNDFIDAEAIAEAVDRENMRFVPIKTDDQLDLQALHRVRDRLMTRRTALINQIRAFLLERGIVFAKSPIRLREALPEVLENVNENLTPRMRNLVAMLWSEWKDLELQIMQRNDEVERIASSDEACRRLRQIPGIGPLVATAISSFDRQRRSLPQGTRVRGLDGAAAEAAFDRWQGEAVWNQQARQLLSFAATSQTIAADIELPPVRLYSAAVPSTPTAHGTSSPGDA